MIKISDRQNVLWRRHLIDLLVKRYGISYLEAIERITALMPYDY